MTTGTARSEGMKSEGMKPECTNPDALAPWELEAFADGKNMPHIATHVQTCSHCQAQVEMIHASTAALCSELYRFDCPSPATLRTFFWQELDPPEMASLADHLRICTDCTHEMAALTNFVGSEQTAEAKSALKETLSALPSQLRRRYYELVEQSQVLVAMLVPPVAPQFAGAALRAEVATEHSTDKRSYLFEAQGYDISLIIQTNPDGTRRLSGQALSIDAPQPVSFKLTPLLVPDLPIHGAIDNAGSFSVSCVAVGEHQLILELDGTSVVIPSVTIT